jgi:hypothetical protein
MPPPATPLTVAPAAAARAVAGQPSVAATPGAALAAALNAAMETV